MVLADTHPAVDTHRVVGHILVVDTRRVVVRILVADTRRVADHILAVDCYRDRLEVVMGEYTHHIDLADLGLDLDQDSNSCTYSSFLHDMSSIV